MFVSGQASIENDTQVLCVVLVRKFLSRLYELGTNLLVDPGTNHDLKLAGINRKVGSVTPFRYKFKSFRSPRIDPIAMIIRSFA